MGKHLIECQGTQILLISIVANIRLLQGYQDLARCLVEKRTQRSLGVGMELSHRAHASMCNVLDLIPSTENIFKVWIER